jgi:glutamate/tyrosine decarboxylase-like PLP-dependent enzyme
MVDDMLGFLEGIRAEPAWRPMPREVVEELSRPAPVEGEGAEAAYADFRRLVLPYRMGNVHPRFWGRVMGTGTPFGMLAEMLTAGMNTNVSGLHSAASHVEAQVLSWFKPVMGMPPEASGVLVSGCSAANLVGLTVARDEKGRRVGVDVYRQGVQALPGRPTLYTSEDAHNSVDRAAMLLGLGVDAVRKVPMDAAFRVRADVLERMVEEDRAKGLLPLCVVGNAGTAATGAIDDLSALADVAARQGLWFHVDGAFGAWAGLSPALRGRVAGIERADSVAFDLHKWMYVPYDVGCVLVRDAAAHRRAMSATQAGYIAQAPRGIESDPFRFNELGPQLSRNFRALKVWLSVKEHGLAAYARQIEQNVAQAALLAALAEGHPELELLSPAALNVVCLRYNDGRLDEAALDRVNAEVLMRLHERGVAVPTTGKVRGKRALRFAIVNHRSRREDFVATAEAVVALGRELVAEQAP